MARALGFVLCLVASLAAPAPAATPAALPAPQFLGEARVATNEGHATLAWSLPEGTDGGSDVAFELEQARAPDFDAARLRHRGPARGLFVSGLRGGETWFRVRAIGTGGARGPWSAPLVVAVRYPDAGRVVPLLLVGCAVFAATLAAIVTGWRRHRMAAAA